MCVNATKHDHPAQNGTTMINTRASYYCEWSWWNNEYWVSLTRVKTKERVKSFYKCAMHCCRNPYCSTFDYYKKNKICYLYNENIRDDQLEYYKSKGWKMGALTYKNGYSYV